MTLLNQWVRRCRRAGTSGVVRRRALVVGALLAAIPAARARAVSVSPNALFIDSKTRSGVLTLFNPGTLPEEIEISFAFGYPKSDDKGNVSVPLVQVVPAGEPSLVQWVRAFPRRLRLEPGQRQTVRVLVQPPAGLANGEYWGRIIIRSRGGRPPIEQQQGQIRMQIELGTEIVTAVSYRNGAVRTGIAVKGTEATVADSGAKLRLDLEREGNAAYLGHIRAELVSGSGQVLSTVDDDFAAYYQLRRVLTLPVPKGASLAGATIRYRVSTDRSDVPPESLVKGPAVTGSVPIQS